MNEPNPSARPVKPGTQHRVTPTPMRPGAGTTRADTTALLRRDGRSLMPSLQLTRSRVTEPPATAVPRSHGSDGASPRTLAERHDHHPSPSSGTSRFAAKTQRDPRLRITA